MTKDFSKKMTMVLREDLVSWQLTNTVGHIGAYLGNKMTEPFDTGKYFISQDSVNFTRNSQFAVIAVKANASQLQDLAQQLKDSSLLWIMYVQEMIDMIDDEQLADSLKTKNFSEQDILGIGVFGPKDELKILTSELKLWK